MIVVMIVAPYILLYMGFQIALYRKSRQMRKWSAYRLKTLGIKKDDENRRD